MLDPYRSAFDPKHIGTSDRFEEPPPHKFLFDCYVYEYHAMEFANLLAELVRLLHLHNAVDLNLTVVVIVGRDYQAGEKMH